MSYRGGLALVKKNLYTYVASRGFFWTLALSWMMQPIIYMFVWLVVVGDGNISSFDRKDFISYYVCLIVINQLTYPTSHWTVGDNIYSGRFSFWLLRPINPIFEAISTDLAVKVVGIPFVALFSILTMIIFDINLLHQARNINLFIITLLLAQILRFIMAYTIAIGALITTRINSLLSINDTFIFLLAGQAIPTVLLPTTMQKISNFLPYRYMLGFPIEVLLGKLTFDEIIWGLSIQVFYIIVVFIIMEVVWKIGLKRYTAHGG